MARSIDDVIADVDLPMPQPGGETLQSYAQRIATIGAHHGAAWALTNRPPAIVVAAADAPAEKGQWPDDSAAPHPSGTLDLSGQGSTD